MRSLWAKPWILLAACAAGSERRFQGVYTIVNVATGRQLVTDAKGFYSTAADAIPKTHFWHIDPAENATYTIRNADSGLRVYAQLGQEGRQGFFVIGSETPVYRDQRWRIELQEEGGYTLTNLKSQRMVADGVDGLMASTNVQQGSYWWLISLERDELGIELARQRHEQCQEPRVEKSFQNVAGFFTGLLMAILMAILMALALWLRPRGFAYYIHKTQADGVVRQVVRVQCPGVRQEDIEVKLIPNGCDVLLHRRSLPGLKEVWWKHRFHFSLSEGFFEFVEEQMQLENGILVLVLREVRQDRTIRFAHCQHFCMDAFDDELCWEVAEADKSAELQSTKGSSTS